MRNDELITVSTAAQLAGRSESTIKLWATKGLLPSIRLPTGIRLYTRRDVERIAREHAQRHEVDARG